MAIPMADTSRFWTQHTHRLLERDAVIAREVEYASLCMFARHGIPWRDDRAMWLRQDVAQPKPTSNGFNMFDPSSFPAALQGVSAVFVMKPPQITRASDFAPFLSALKKIVSTALSRFR